MTENDSTEKNKYMYYIKMEESFVMAAGFLFGSQKSLI